jgi:hypothetical protein
MKKHYKVSEALCACAEGCGEVQLKSRTRATAHPSLDQPPPLLKGTTVFTLLAILGIASVAGIAGSIVVSARDGYRRQPKETFARTV